MDLGTEQEHDLKIAIRLLPQTNKHILKTVPKISQAEESALELLRARTQRQRAKNLLLNHLLRTWNNGWITRQINWVPPPGGENYRLSPASWTSADLPRRYGPLSMYQRFDSGCLPMTVILHPQPLNVSIEGSTKMCIEGQSSSPKHIADAYSIGWRRSLCRSVQNSDLWWRV